jgi:hypothetical protein
MPTLSAANCVALTGRSEELGVIEAGLSDLEIGGIVICGPAGVVHPAARA